MKHLYVHIPFCRSRCAYCDFASEPVGPHARAGRVERYLEALLAELGERAGAPGAGAGPGYVSGPGPGAAREPGAAPAAVFPAEAARFETVYVGGGTPTALPEEALLGLVRALGSRTAAEGHGRAVASDKWGRPDSIDPVDPVTAAGAPCPAGPPEFTVEANPGTIGAALLERLAGAGVTRLSLGVQSFAPALRAALGRRVTDREIADALAAIRATGWREWNIDLVFGIPGQTWESAVADLDAAVAAGPTHISLYDLTYTPVFAAWVDAGAGDADRGGAAADRVGGLCIGAEPRAGSGSRVAAATAFAEECYAAAAARLEAAGYRRYEVSNFALPGHECRHNLAYWRGEDYLGIGASAVSTVGLERRTNPRSVIGYLAGEAPDIEMLTARTRLWERAMLGLRTAEGVEEEAILPVLDEGAFERLSLQGCVERRCGKLRLNPGFLDVSNAAIGALLAGPGEP